MFRKMRRAKQELEMQECVEILKQEPAKVREICTNLCRKFTDDEAYLQHELKYSEPQVLCLVLKPDHISGKLVNES